MITEFFSEDDSLRYYTVIPFSLGILVIAYYYVGELWKWVGIRKLSRLNRYE